MDGNADFSPKINMDSQADFFIKKINMDGHADFSKIINMDGDAYFFSKN